MKKCLVQIIKKKRKQSILQITRSDGTVCWAKIHPGTEDHDLAHVAVEEILGYKRAFFGTINAGAGIHDFTLPNEKRPAQVQAALNNPEALITEYIVNLLQTEKWNSPLGDYFIPQLKKTLFERGLSYPEELNEGKLEAIRKRYDDLIRRWNILAEGQILEVKLHL